MYFLNFFSRIFFTISLKKKLAIEYKVRAPKEIDIIEMTVPSHLPNKIPETIKIGDPKPSKETQTIENIKK
jgi:hypothetical protein